MAILAGFRDVKPGVTYAGVAIGYICVDTKNRFHLMSAIERDTEVAVFENHKALTPDMAAEDRAELFWLWESLAPKNL